MKALFPISAIIKSTLKGAAWELCAGSPITIKICGRVVMLMDLIEIIDELVSVSKRLLDICCEQAKIIEEHGIVSREYSEKNRGEMESFKEILKKAAGG